MTLIKISIVTVVRNDMPGLLKTLNSIFSQTYANIESIVIDGASMDGTTEVIKSFKEKIDFTISEPDSGVYNAMNKGLKKASGEYVLFLNAGDILFNPDSLTNLVTNSGLEDLIYGDLVFKRQDQENIFSYPNALDFIFFIHNSLPHPSTLIKRELFSKYGYYREEFDIVADWAFFLDVIAKYNASYKHVALPISIFELGGKSSNALKVEIEKNRYLMNEYKFFYNSYLNLLKLNGTINFLPNSRVLRLILKLLPQKYRVVK